MKILFILIISFIWAVPDILAQIDPQAFDSIFHISENLKKQQKENDLDKKGYLYEDGLYVKKYFVYFPNNSIEKSEINTDNLNFILERKKNVNCEWVYFWVCRNTEKSKILNRIEIPLYMRELGPIESVLFNDTEFVILYGHVNSVSNHYGAIIYNSVSGKSYRVFKINHDKEEPLFIDGVKSSFAKDCYYVFPIGKPPSEIAYFAISYYAGVGRFHNISTFEAEKELCDNDFCDGINGVHVREERTYDTTALANFGMKLKEPYSEIRIKLLKHGWKPVKNNPSTLPEIEYTIDSTSCWANLTKGKIGLEIGLDKCYQAIYVNSAEIRESVPSLPKKENSKSYSINAGGKVPCKVFEQDDYKLFGISGQYISIKKKKKGLKVYEQFELPLWGMEKFFDAKSTIISETGISPTSCFENDNLPSCIWFYNTDEGFIRKSLITSPTNYGMSLKYSYENVTFLKAIEQIRGEDLLK